MSDWMPAYLNEGVATFEPEMCERYKDQDDFHGGSPA